jgi:hypothetical protein
MDQNDLNFQTFGAMAHQQQYTGQCFYFCSVLEMFFVSFSFGFVGLVLVLFLPWFWFWFWFWWAWFGFGFNFCQFFG